jgi:hypothetical protein
LRNASGVLKKAVDGWGLGWILALSSGAPFGLTGVNTLWANGALDLVRPDLWDNKAGKAEWSWEDHDGYYFGKKYMRISDPQCETNLVTTNLRSSCRNSLKALAEIAGYEKNAAGKMVPVPGPIIFQNSTPGKQGNYTGNPLTGVGRFSLDMNMSKSIEFMEGKRLELRIDASNVLNHATPSAGSGDVGARINNISGPSVTVNSTTENQFGLITTKAQNRIFQGKIRISF